jgi:uncharacterized repeat protein (TIGR02543 family)
MRTTYTKVLALILALVMTVSLLPMTVLADEPAASPAAAEEAPSAAEEASSEEPADDKTPFVPAEGADAKVAIEDDIASSGCLTATFSSSDDDVTYRWYRSDDAVTFKRVYYSRKLLNISGSSNTWLENISGDSNTQNWLNVSVDEGAEKTYFAEAFNSKGQSLGKSAAFHVPYATELKNGSFEEPNITGSGRTNTYKQYQNGQVPYWKFTNPISDGRAIEIVGSTSKAHGLTGVLGSGSQCAEINCESDGALYQDVLVTPGQTLNWQIAHRGRQNFKDVMAVIIMASSEAANYLSEASLNRIEGNAQKQAVGADLVVFDTDKDGNAWTVYSTSDVNNKAYGYTYTVPENVYLVRFFFSAVSCGSKNNTIGNMVDNVSFTTDSLPAIPVTLTVNYRDKSGNTLADAESRVQNAGVSYTVSAREFTNYTLDTTATTRTIGDVTEKLSETTVIGTMPANGEAVITFYYNPNSYHITYNANAKDATGTTKDEAAHPYKTSAAVLANGFSRDGYTFNGWTSDAAGKGKSYAAGDDIVVTGNITLYAQWLPNMSASADGYKGIYDGVSHTISVQDTSENATVTYSTTSDGSYTSTNPGYTDVGKYTVYYKVEKDGYAPFFGNATVTITPKPVTVTVKNANKNYGAKDPSFTATVEGTLNNDSVKYDLNRAAGESVGTYAINATGAKEQGNYKVTYVPGKLTINSVYVPNPNPNPNPNPGTTIDANIPTGLNGIDHIAYIIGRQGYARPEAPITRAEVASIFFRLLTDEMRETYLTSESSFSDVHKGEWYNTMVDTLAEMGIIKGYPDGTFRPNAYITRAEFAAIAARFDSTDITGKTATFSDIATSWAKDEIVRTAVLGWTNGYPDGTFRPQNDITRAEVATLVNRVLKRVPGKTEDLLADMVTWPDNLDTTKWYYLAIQEASNTHDYEKYTGDDKTTEYEKWTKLKENPDWTKYQK